MSLCPFCQILHNDFPASIVHRDDKCVAFLDTRPITQGHLLVVPAAHAPSLADLLPDAAAHLFKVAHKLAVALRRSDLNCQGVTLLLSDGPAAGQEVPHAHLHIIPRYPHDGFRISPPARDSLPPLDEIESIGHRIRSALMLPRIQLP